jgi:metallo-beta-lactamase family protein
LIEGGKTPAFPIIIDSPLARRATEVFKRHANELENGDELLRALNSPYLTITETVEQSKALDQRDDFHVVISASGMCDAGRIRHRLKNWLWRPEATVLLVGYQAAGTLGRVLLEGANSVRIHGEEIAVTAAIRSLDVYSGHADAAELETWLQQRKPVIGTVFLVHGEAPTLNWLRERFGRILAPEQIAIPELDQTFILGSGRAVRIDSDGEPRLEQAHAGQPDSSNGEAELLLDISDALARAADERARGIIIRRLQRALAED